MPSYCIPYTHNCIIRLPLLGTECEFWVQGQIKVWTIFWIALYLISPHNWLCYETIFFFSIWSCQTSDKSAARQLPLNTTMVNVHFTMIDYTLRHILRGYVSYVFCTNFDCINYLLIKLRWKFNRYSEIPEARLPGIIRCKTDRPSRYCKLILQTYKFPMITKCLANAVKCRHNNHFLNGG